MKDSDVAEFNKNLKLRGLRIATAESLTAGLIAATIARIPGSSEVLEGGFVTYTNTQKQNMLGVSAVRLETYTAVSPQVAEAMALGALERTGADLALAVTGYADHKDPSLRGLVYIGLATSFNGASGYKADAPVVEVFQHRFTGERNEVREQVVKTAIGHAGRAVQRVNIS